MTKGIVSSLPIILETGEVALVFVGDMYPLDRLVMMYDSHGITPEVAETILNKLGMTLHFDKAWLVRNTPQLRERLIADGNWDKEVPYDVDFIPLCRLCKIGECKRHRIKEE